MPDGGRFSRGGPQSAAVNAPASDMAAGAERMAALLRETEAMAAGFAKLDAAGQAETLRKAGKLETAALRELRACEAAMRKIYVLTHAAYSANDVATAFDAGRQMAKVSAMSETARAAADWMRGRHGGGTK